MVEFKNRVNLPEVEMNNVEFRNNVKDILNHLSDTAYLENHNLIYAFIGGEDISVGGRIQTLRESFRSAINFLRPPEETPSNAPEWRCYKILTLRFLQSKEWHLIEDELGLSQRQVQRDLKKGLDALISILWDRYAPKMNESAAGATGEVTSSDTYDEDLIIEELKNWEITFDLVNLSGLIQHALQLCNSLLKTDLQDRVDLLEVDKNLNVMVDQVLTRQGLYKVLAMIGSSKENITVKLCTRKLNEFFIELSFHFHHQFQGLLDQWKMGKLFFTIQGLNQRIAENSGETTISIILPVRKQISCLVIDDVEFVRRLIERMLGSYGIQVFGADNYADAVSLIQFMKPDFILLDVLMPKMDGWQMITNIKSNPDMSDIPVIICSVLYEPELSQAVGAKAYIRKPINRLELIKTLQELDLIKSSYQENP